MKTDLIDFKSNQCSLKVFSINALILLNWPKEALTIIKQKYLSLKYFESKEWSHLITTFFNFLSNKECFISWINILKYWAVWYKRMQLPNNVVVNQSALKKPTLIYLFIFHQKLLEIKWSFLSLLSLLSSNAVLEPAFLRR